MTHTTHKGDDVHTVEAAIRDDGWQPIKTAPKDGTRVLIVISGVNRPVLAYFNGAGWSTYDGNDWSGRFVTYWVALPPLPTTPP